MTDRDRLIELFNAIEKDPAITCPAYKTDKTCKECKYTINESMCNYIERKVDYLLAHGVIVIPCNVGQTVYTIFERKIETLEITQAKTKESKNGIRIDCLAENDFLKMPFSKCHIGNSIFLTKEEAEEKLKELKDNA